MQLFTKTTKLLMVLGMVLSISACKKNEDIPLNQVPIDLPGSLSLVYGDQQEILLPENIRNASDLQIRFDFNATENVQINSSSRLHDKLTEAVTIENTTGKIHVNSTLLYPNGAVSASSGSKIPQSYKITVVASSAEKAFEGKQSIEVKVTPAKVNIKGLDNEAAIPFTYVLYGNPANFELEAPGILLEGTTWRIENSTSLSAEVTLKSNHLQFSASAGDPNKKAEKAYDVVPSLQKDGFSIALRSFRVIFMPQIKFFYGQYYADLDLTILLNQLHIALSNGYKSTPPTLYPQDYKSTFEIVSIEKDNKAFENIDDIFTIDSKTGSVSVKKNSVLTEGAYKVTVKALTTTGLGFTTTLTLNMSKGE